MFAHQPPQLVITQSQGLGGPALVVAVARQRLLEQLLFDPRHMGAEILQQGRFPSVIRVRLRYRFGSEW